MRLPLAIPFDARNTSTAKDARLTNTVSESYEGRLTVSRRAGLQVLTGLPGAGEGVVCFNGGLIALSGTDVYSVATGSTPVSCVFTGSDGASVFTNDGTGGDITDSGLANSHTTSTTRSYSAPSSLRVWDEASLSLSAPISEGFFTFDHSISFQLWVDTAATTIGGFGEGYVEIINQPLGSPASKFIRWELVIADTDGNGTLQYKFVFDNELAEAAEFIFTPVSTFTAVEIGINGGTVFSTYGGLALTNTGSASVSVNDTATDPPALFNTYQLADVWDDGNGVFFVDDLVMTNQYAPELIGTIEAGTYDFAQSVSA